MANITISGLPSKTGTIDDGGYLHLNESGVDKKATVAQLKEKISSQYSSDINSFLGSANKAEGRANLSIDRRVAVDNADYTILATDKVVAQVGTMSAARIFSLPDASTMQAGAEITIIDESGSVTDTNRIIVQRYGSDTIDGVASINTNTPHGVLKLICNGTNSWKVVTNTSDVFNKLLPIGSIFSIASLTIPTGYLECNGATISRTTYANLFSIIGTIYGAGNGSTTFQIPDLRGEFIRGLDTGRGVDSGRSIGTYQADEFKRHNHYMASEHTFSENLTGDESILVGRSISQGGLVNENYEYALAGSSAQAYIGKTSDTGGLETRPRNVAFPYIIKY